MCLLIENIRCAYNSGTSFVWVLSIKTNRISLFLRVHGNGSLLLLPFMVSKVTFYYVFNLKPLTAVFVLPAAPQPLLGFLHELVQ